MHLYLIIVLFLGAILFAASSYFARDPRLLIVSGGILIFLAALIISSGEITYTTGTTIKQPVQSSTAFFLNETFFNTTYKAIQTENKENYLLKKGKEYIISDYDPEIQSDEYNMFCTNKSKISMKWIVAVEQAGQLRLYEQPNISSQGLNCEESDQCSLKNKNRNYMSDTNVSFWEDPTLNDKGDLIFNSYVPASTQNKGVGAISQEFGWVLKPDTCYLSEFNSDNAQTRMSNRLIFYKENGG